MPQDVQIRTATYTKLMRGAALITYRALSRPIDMNSPQKKFIPTPIINLE